MGVLKIVRNKFPFTTQPRKNHENFAITYLSDAFLLWLMLCRDQEGYECQCCTGFAGPHCEEIDACSPSPCTNNGICVDLSQGHEGNAYQCLCPYGKFFCWQAL